MNIFMTNRDPFQCAEEHCMVHVRKMIIEYAQMMSTTHHLKNSIHKEFVFKIAHENHPSTKWVRECAENYEWLFLCWHRLLNIYHLHSGKYHASSRIFEFLQWNPISCKEIPYVLARDTEYRKDLSTRITKLPCAMPDEYKISENSITNYHLYLNEKFEEWRNRERKVKVEFVFENPVWYQEGN